MAKKHGKRFLIIESKIEKKVYTPLEAFEFLTQNAKPAESIDVVIKVNINPKKTDQTIKGVWKNIPNGIGKEKSVTVFSKDNIEFILKSGAKYAGFEDLIEKIKNEEIKSDVYIATTDLMPELAKLGLGRILKGQMPNPKLGTVVSKEDLQKTIIEQKAGQITLKSQAKLIQTSIGRAHFSAKALSENFNELIKTVISLRPNIIKHTEFILEVFTSATMSPSLQISFDKE